MSATTRPIAAQPSALTPERIDLDGLLRRLYLPTIRRLYPELEDRAAAEGMSHRDYLAVLVGEEVAHRAETRIQRATRKAQFPFLRTIEEFDFKLQTSVRLSLLGSYLGPELVTDGRALIQNPAASPMASMTTTPLSMHTVSSVLRRNQKR